MPSSPNPPDHTDQDEVFTDAEQALFDEGRTWFEAQIEGMDHRQKHRVLLGAASEIVDAAADLAAKHRPGVRVVELGLLAERICYLAFNPGDADDAEG